MDIKREMIYRDDVLQVKPEPHLSPCATTIVSKAINNSNNGINGIVTTIQQQPGTVTIATATTSNILTSNGLVTTALPNNGLNTNSGPFSSLGGKRPRADDWLNSSSSGTTPAVTLSVAPSSPIQSSHNFTVIGNGYHSPGSNGSYDPYSPTGKTGKFFNSYWKQICRNFQEIRNY
ncbi:hypothetical protein QE152_g33774 [Popillia japonica]|uniref:Uncharacterized protein n=1 Tax=Popillia japonica TaxID=7064 RepID=A0AAW1IVP7_POPJA